MPQLLFTPLAECRWCKLLGEARENKFDPTKRPTWSVELVLKNNDPDHIAWIEEMEGKFSFAHGESAKKSSNWIPVKPDKEKPRELSVARFNLTEFERKDGSKSEGPVVFDSNNNPWDPKKAIGNGSKIIIAFDIYAWKGNTGAGMTFQPRQVQVVEYLAYEADKAPAVSAFTPVPGGFVDSDNVFNEAPGLTTED